MLLLTENSMKSTSDNPATTGYTIFYQFIAMATIISVPKIGEATFHHSLNYHENTHSTVDGLLDK